MIRGPGGGSSGKRTGESSSSRTGLRARMLIILTLAGLPGIIVAVLLTVQKLSEETEQIEKSVARLASLGAAQHETVLANARTLLKAVVQSQGSTPVTRADCRATLNAWSDKPPIFASLTVFDPEGDVICTDSGGELPYTVEDQAWFEQAREKQRFTVSEYGFGQDGSPLLIAADAVISPEHETRAIAALDISLNWLDFIGNDVDLPPEATITAIGPGGRILSQRAAGGEDDGVPPSETALLLAVGMKEGTMRAEDRSGATRVYGYSRTDSGGVTVMVGLPRFIEYSEWGKALLNTLLSPAAILVFALAAAAWASEALVVRHVRSLIATTGEIAGGNLTARSEVDYDEHELGELSASVDLMAETLASQQQELEQQVVDNQLVAREMEHRVMNSLALAQSIALQTNRRSPSQEEFSKAFTGRMQALAASNRLLADGQWSSAGVREILEAIVNPWASSEPNSIELHGPEVRLNPRSVMALSLSAHELATNAAKYGALSQPGGRTTIRWTIDDADGESLFVLEWRESGGPQPTTADRRGFGTQLLQAMVGGKLGGEIVHDLRPDGLVCTIWLPLKDPAVDTKVNGQRDRQLAAHRD